MSCHWVFVYLSYQCFCRSRWQTFVLSEESPAAFSDTWEARENCEHWLETRSRGLGSWEDCPSFLLIVVSWRLPWLLVIFEAEEMTWMTEREMETDADMGTKSAETDHCHCRNSCFALRTADMRRSLAWSSWMRVSWEAWVAWLGCRRGMMLSWRVWWVT